jgi:hypothetical protein
VQSGWHWICVSLIAWHENTWRPQTIEHGSGTTTDASPASDTLTSAPASTPASRLPVTSKGGHAPGLVSGVPASDELQPAISGSASAIARRIAARREASFIE